jgi:hypothetical protein
MARELRGSRYEGLHHGCRLGMVMHNAQREEWEI